MCIQRLETTEAYSEVQMLQLQNNISSGRVLTTLEVK